MDLLSCIISSCKKIMRIILDLHQIDTSLNYKQIFFLPQETFFFCQAYRAAGCPGQNKGHPCENELDYHLAGPRGLKKHQLALILVVLTFPVLEEIPSSNLPFPIKKRKTGSKEAKIQGNRKKHTGGMNIFGVESHLSNHLASLRMDCHAAAAQTVYDKNNSHQMKILRSGSISENAVCNYTTCLTGITITDE